MCLAVPGELLSISEGEPLCRTARVRFGGVIKQINVAFVPEAQVGDYVLVHAGCAISVLDAAEAQRVLAALATLAEPELDPSAEAER
jgi:hydrogenase expression/formation protein HypC